MMVPERRKPTNALYIFGPMSGRVGPGGNWRELTVDEDWTSRAHMRIQVHDTFTPRIVRYREGIAEIVV